MQCPTCGKPVEYVGNPARQFCSERCKMIDLGKWAGGVYRVPTLESPTDDFESSNGPSESPEQSSQDED
jgi:endogenous inhibitor of DNA gyrase (YacG/DUF329 family)